MTYSIDFRPSALKALRKLPKSVRIRVAETLNSLASQPFPSGVKKLINEENVFRVRVGDYRIVYQVISDKLLILVLRVGHRKDIYR